MHPLYHHARRLIGRPVYVYHVNGRVYAGHLHSVTHDGIYVLPVQGSVGMATADFSDDGMEYALAAKPPKWQLVYSPGWYFGWGALAGLSVAALAAPFMW